MFIMYLAVRNPVFPKSSYLTKVVKVVLVSDPFIVGLETVWLVGDVPYILSLAHKEFSLEKLNEKNKTCSHRQIQKKIMNAVWFEGSVQWKQIHPWESTQLIFSLINTWAWEFWASFPRYGLSDIYNDCFMLMKSQFEVSFGFWGLP